MLRQDYGGIGAYVGLRPQGFVILQPIYNGPAYRAGLRSLDTILEVDGQKATEVIARDGLSRVITKLKGKPGSTVRVKFFRRGFSKPVETDITRERVRVESALWARLPGELGYVRLTRFGERTPSELDRALDELVKKGRAKGLVLDLRDDPGGLLKSAVETADRFLSAGKLIVYSAGRPEFAPRKDFTAGGGPEDEALPMVVLVNAGTASGSEIVAGALQAQKRALLVGEKTFGKGSVQQIMPLRATSGETHLRLTVAKYFLPDGRCIHEQGVEPDVAAGPAEQDEFVLRALAALRRKHVFEDYVRANWAAHKDTFMELAESDGGSAAAYPGLVGLHEGLGKTGLSLDDVRVEVRQVARKLAQDELRREFACDLEGDEVLQRGILELLRKLNVQPASIAQYKDYPERFKDVAAEGALTALPATPPEANHTEP
jgi:C-terminal peptidase prc